MCSCSICSTLPKEASLWIPISGHGTFSDSSASLRVTLEYTVAADGAVAATDGSSATPTELSKTLLAVNRVNANNPESFFMMGTPELSEFNNG